MSSSLPLRFASVACLALMLSACISGKPQPETYTDPSSGVQKTIESDKDSCIRSCNDDYERCTDRGTTYQDDRPGDSKALFGVDASCRNDLRACLPRCKGR